MLRRMSFSARFAASANYATTPLGITKRTYMTETVNVEFRFEMFNAFNRHRLGGIRNNVSDPFNFGKVTGAGGNRQGQFALKINF